MRKWILLLPLTLLIFSFDFSGIFSKKTNQVYISKTDGNTLETTWTIENKSGGFLIEGKDDETFSQIYCTKSFIIKKYTFQSSKENSNYSLSRTDGSLACGGKVKGKQNQAKLHVGRKKWIQQYMYGLQPFAQSNDSKWYFTTVNPNDFSLVSMVASKEDVETLVIGKTSYQAQKIKITLTGMKSMFWSASIWFDTKTHLCLRYEGNEGPGTSTTVITYKGEK